MSADLQFSCHFVFFTLKNDKLDIQFIRKRDDANMQYIIEDNDEGIVTLTLNKPATLNTLCIDLMSELLLRLGKLANDENIKALIITGSGRAFCAGADLSGDHLADGASSGTPLGETVAELMEAYFNPMMEAIYSFPRPVVTAINGIAAGGGVGLALCADVVIVSDKASMKIVQAQQLGIVADLGAHWLLSRLVGRGRTLAMCMMGETIQAARLKEWGLVWECVNQEQLLDHAKQAAKKLSCLSNNTVLATRRLTDGASAVTFEKSLFDEKETQRTLCSEAVFIDSITSFFASR